jgi:Xaa-Pro aminopeptidase
MFQNFEPRSDRTFAGRHLPKLRDVLAARGLDALIVPHDDEYLNEYLPDHTERLMWVSGFSGSAGLAIVTTKAAGLFSDGRYTLQMREQTDEAHFSFHDNGNETVAAWLDDHLGAGDKVGYDPMLFSSDSLAPFERAAERSGFELVPVQPNPIDEAWADRPSPPLAPVHPHAETFSGRSSSDKRQSIAEKLRDKRVDAAFLSAPHSLAWLFNIRGGDVHASPLPLGRGLIRADGTASLFLHPAKVTGELPTHLGQDVELHAEDRVDAALEKLGSDGLRVLVDPALTPVYFINLLSASGATVVRGEDPCALPRAAKNEVELQGSRTAHIRDGVAVTRFLEWFAATAPSGELTEIEAARKLESFRQETNQLRDISFDTISGTGGHGASPHYRVTTESDRTIEPNSLFLIDSGGQYEDGTTDITRVMAVGTPTDDMRRHYTLVLKGHIALATARFPEGTSGHQLDALARRPLWEAGLDYDHGTGHGVGSYLGVHEGPQNISKKPIRQALVPGMICSNEPGYYKPGEYGIRIENLVIVRAPQPVPGGDRPMLSFETITLAPFERELIDVSLLTNEEREWVDDYHRRVRDALTDQLPGATAQWLERRTAPL